MCIHAHTHPRFHVSVCACCSVHLCACIHIYIYIYTDTYSHTPLYYWGHLCVTRLDHLQTDCSGDGSSLPQRPRLMGLRTWACCAPLGSRFRSDRVVWSEAYDVEVSRERCGRICYHVALQYRMAPCVRHITSAVGRTRDPSHAAAAKVST